MLVIDIAQCSIGYYAQHFFRLAAPGKCESYMIGRSLIQISGKNNEAGG